MSFIKADFKLCLREGNRVGGLHTDISDKM